MLYKYCKCGKRIPQSIPRCADCQKLVKEASAKRWEKSPSKRRAYMMHYQYTETSKIHRTARWRRMSKAIVEQCDGIDLWAWHTDGILKPGNTVHHIVPIEEDPSLAFDPGNLICLSQSSHVYIHMLYDEGEEVKGATQDALRQAKVAHRQRFHTSPC